MPYAFNPFTGKLDYYESSDSLQPSVADWVKYVSPTGNDANNGDTALTPYLTTQKALDVICDYRGKKTIYLANGTYDGFVVPSYAIDTIAIIGDVTDNTNVIIEFDGVNPVVVGHGGTIGGSGLVSVFNNAQLILTGMTIQGGVAGVYVDNTKLVLRYVKFLNNSLPILSGIKGLIIFEFSDDGSVLIVNEDNTGVAGITLGSQGLVVVSQPITIEGFLYPVDCQDSSKIEFVDPYPMILRCNDVVGAIGIKLSQNSTMNGDANLQIFGGGGGQQIGILIDGSSAIGSIEDWEFEDLEFGIKHLNGGYSDTIGIGLQFTNVDHEIYYEPGSSQLKNVRITDADSPYTPTYDVETIFCDTDDGVITVNLPPGENKRKYRIINVGTSGDDVTVNPNGAELLKGANASQTIAGFGELLINYETTEGWW